ETIEFTTDSGQVVRTNPLRSDVGLLDRTGQTVTVFYDRQRPERMVAPKNGRSMSPGGPLAKSGAALAMLVFLTFFVIISQGMIHRSPFSASLPIQALPSAQAMSPVRALTPHEHGRPHERWHPHEHRHPTNTAAGLSARRGLRPSATPGAGCPGPHRGRPRNRPAVGR